MSYFGTITCQSELVLDEVQEKTVHNVCGTFDCDVRYISITFSATFDSCINIIFMYILTNLGI